MSIISDALKKVQSGRSREVVLKNEPDRNIVFKDRSGNSRKRSRRKPFFVGFTLIGIVLVSGLFVFLYWNPDSTGTMSLRIPMFTRPDGIFKQTAPIPSTQAQSAKAAPKTPAHPRFSTMRILSKKLPELGGIMYSPSMPQAVLDGKIVREGSTLDGFTVDKILHDKVIVSSGEDEHELKMP